MSFDSMMWKIKRFFKKAFPIALIAGVLYFGYNLYKKGTFRGGFSQSFHRVVRQLPYFGSRFRGYSGSSSFATNSGYRRGGRKHYRQYKKHFRRGRSRRSR